MTQLFARLAEPFCLGKIASLPREVTGLAVRADLVGDPEPGALRAAFSGSLLYLLPSGARENRELPSQRLERLRAAARSYDLVALDAETDLIPEALNAVPPAKRMPALFAKNPDIQTLRHEFDRINSIPAPYYLVTVSADNPMDGLAPLSLLRALGRTDVIAFAEEAGVSWSLPLSARFGAPIVFGALNEKAVGDMSVQRLIEDYGLPQGGPVRELFGMVGGAVESSLAPRLFNAAFRAEGRDALYLAFEAASFPRFFRDFMEGNGFRKLGIPLNGLTVRAPFKERVLDIASEIEPEAIACGSANMLVRSGSGWRAGTSDFAGVLSPLRARGLSFRRLVAAVIGMGGAGRGAALALTGAGARVSLVHRDPIQGQKGADRLGLPFVALADFEPEKFNLAVHATPVGKNGEPPIFDPARMAPDSTVLEYVYGGRATALMRAARMAGMDTVDGYEVLAAQLRAQYSFFTQSPAPAGVMEGLLSKIP